MLCNPYVLMSEFYSRGHSELETHEHRSGYLRLRNIGCLQKGILEFACALLNQTDSYYFLNYVNQCDVAFPFQVCGANALRASHVWANDCLSLSINLATKISRPQSAIFLFMGSHERSDVSAARLQVVFSVTQAFRTVRIPHCFMVYPR